MSLDLEKIKQFAESAWYYPGARPDGTLDAKDDVLALIREVERLQVIEMHSGSDLEECQCWEQRYVEVRDLLAEADVVIDVTEEWHNNPGPVPVGFQLVINAMSAYRAAKGEMK